MLINLTRELELTIEIPANHLIAHLTGSSQIAGPFGDNAYRLEELATHGWQLINIDFDLDTVTLVLSRVETINQG